jgi:hypothetical protein
MMEKGESWVARFIFCGACTAVPTGLGLNSDLFSTIRPSRWDSIYLTMVVSPRRSYADLCSMSACSKAFVGLLASMRRARLERGKFSKSRRADLMVEKSLDAAMGAP